MINNFEPHTSDSNERSTLLRLYKRCKDLQNAITKYLTDVHCGNLLGKL